MPLERTKENAEKNVSFNTSMSAPLLRQSCGQEEFIMSPVPSTQDGKSKFHKKRVVTLRHGDSLENDRFMYHPYILSYYEGENGKGQRQPRYRSKLPKQSSDENRDFAAMSVPNLYKSADNLDSEMDTERDFPSALRRPNPRIVIPESSIESQELPNESSQNNCECPKPDNLSCPVPTIYFTDGMRSVDFILVWDAFTEDAVKPEAQEKRKIFEANLAKEGLELEYVPQESNGLNFVKIHAPQEVLRRYGEILKLRMPMREELCKAPREFRQNRLYNATAFIQQVFHARTVFLTFLSLSY
jgi:hypothetical protein